MSSAGSVWYVWYVCFMVFMVCWSLSYVVKCYCTAKKSLVVLITEWLPWLQETVVYFGIRG